MVASFLTGQANAGDDSNVHVNTKDWGQVPVWVNIRKMDEVMQLFSFASSRVSQYHYVLSWVAVSIIQVNVQGCAHSAHDPPQS